MVRLDEETQVARLLAYIIGTVHQELLLRNESLIAENRILRPHLSARLRSTDPQRAMLATIGKRFGRQALQEFAWLRNRRPQKTCLLMEADPVLLRGTSAVLGG